MSSRAEVDNASDALTCIGQGVKEANPFKVCFIADNLVEMTNPEVLRRLAQSQTKVVTLAATTAEIIAK